MNNDLNINIFLEWWNTQSTQDLLAPVTKGASPNSRKVIQFGSLYLYNTKRATEKGSAPPIPEILQELRTKIYQVATFIEKDYIFDQVIVNRYLPGQGISPHIDLNIFGKYIVSFTFKGGREMEFTRNEEKFKMYAKERSMYVMTGESRYKWKHQMRPRKKDNGIPRKECFSITFRASPK